MRTRKCDGCGKTYRPDDHAVGTITIKVYDSNHTSWCNPDVYDLCCVCMKKIEKLIQSELQK